MRRLSVINDIDKPQPEHSGFITGSVHIDDTNYPTDDEPGYDVDPFIENPDPRMLGYSDDDDQYSTYMFALHGLNLTDEPISILDLGAGTCDILNYLPNTVSEYHAVELNPLFVEIAKKKFASKNPNIIHANYLDDSIITMDVPTVDWVLNVRNLQMNYGDDLNSWSRFRKTLLYSLRKCNIGTIFILSHDNNGVDAFTNYPIPNVIDVIMEYGLQFVVDYSEMDNIYKLIVFSKEL
jgi:hypothetical protein